MTPHGALVERGSHHSKHFRRTFVLAVVSGILLAGWALPSIARAQQAITLASLQIAIWPEYDRPSSLVILDGKLASSVALPAQVTVHMPAVAKAPNAVAVVAADGSLLTAAYTTAASGGDIIIKFTANSASFRVEYYDPGLVTNGDARSFSFRWRSDYAVGNVSLKVQEPYGSSGLKGQPALTSAGTGGDGLNYDTASLGAMPPGGMVSLDLTYTKTGSVLSATAIGPAPASTPAVATNGLNGSLAWILGGTALGLVLVGGGVTLYVRNSRSGGASARGSRSVRHASVARRAPSPAPQVAAPVRRSAPTAGDAEVPRAAQAATKATGSATIYDGPANFCTQCGQRHQPGDQFCRRCGAPVRDLAA